MRNTGWGPWRAWTCSNLIGIWDFPRFKIPLMLLHCGCQRFHPSQFFFLPVNHLRAGRGEDSEFCLLSLWLCSLGDPRLYPPSSPHPIHWQSSLMKSASSEIKTVHHPQPLMPPGQHDCCGSSMDFSARPEAQVQPLPSCTALGKSLTFSKRWFLHL